MKSEYPFYIAAGLHVLCRRKGIDMWARSVKRGLPGGAYGFRTEHEARNELDRLRAKTWPRVPDTARVERLS